MTKKTLKSDDGDVILERRNSFTPYDTQNFDDRNMTINSNRNSTMNSNYGSEVSYQPPASRNGPYYHHAHQAANNNFEEMQNQAKQMELERNNNEALSTNDSTNTHLRTTLSLTTNNTLKIGMHEQNNIQKTVNSLLTNNGHCLVSSCDETVQVGEICVSFKILFLCITLS